MVARRKGIFGTVEQLGNKRFRARYHGPDGRRHTAPTTFLTKTDARSWLALRHAEIVQQGMGTTAGHPESHHQDHVRCLRCSSGWDSVISKTAPATITASCSINTCFSAFGPLPLASITSQDVRTWYARYGTKTPTMQGTLLRAAENDPQHSGQRREDRRQPVRDQGSRNRQAGPPDPAGHTGRTRPRSPRRCPPLPGDGPARRLVRAAIW